MRGVAEKMRELRRLLGQQAADGRACVPLGHGPADAALMGGLRLGALHEVYAAAAGEGGAAAGFAAALAARVVAARPGILFWLRQDFSALEHGEIHGAGLAELGLDPAQVLMLKVSDATDALKAMGDVLACCGVAAAIVELVGAAKVLDLTASRRLTLAAAEKNVTPVVLRLDAGPEASAAETRWLVRAAPSVPHDDWGMPLWRAELARNRHGMTGEWVMEWSGDANKFREPADPRAVSAATFDRPDRTGAQFSHAV